MLIYLGSALYFSVVSIVFWDMGNKVGVSHFGPVLNGWWSLSSAVSSSDDEEVMVADDRVCVSLFFDFLCVLVADDMAVRVSSDAEIRIYRLVHVNGVCVRCQIGGYRAWLAGLHGIAAVCAWIRST